MGAVWVGRVHGGAARIGEGCKAVVHSGWVCGGCMSESCRVSREGLGVDIWGGPFPTDL